MFDLSVLTRLPIESGAKKFNLTLFDYVKDDLDLSKKKRRQLICLSTELFVTFPRGRQGPDDHKEKSGRDKTKLF